MAGLPPPPSADDEEAAMIAWQDVFDMIAAGRPGDAACPTCKHRPLTVETVDFRTRISCGKCGAFVQGAFG